MAEGLVGVAPGISAGKEKEMQVKKLGEYTCDDFQTGDRVTYVPLHAYGDINHKDVEHGLVSSCNNEFVFVKYYPALTRFGWDGCTSQATNPTELIKVTVDRTI
jgi:threonine dehydrogenase-like Zn-dependent dehydrogenase